MNNVREQRVIALLDSLSTGLLWLTHTGHILSANAEAVCTTGLRSGDRLPAGELLRAVGQAVQHRVPRQARLIGRPDTPGNLVPELLCRVLPGLRDDDGFVLLGTPVHAPSIDASLLMQLLGDDIGPALRRTRQALSIARHEGDEHAAGALLDELDALLDQVAQVVDVGRLWADPAPAAQDRLDLLALLQAAWSEVELQARERVVRLTLTMAQRKQVLAPVYGSASGLRQVLRDCLAAAVQATTPGCVLRLELRQLGPRAQIVFTDCPAFADLPMRHAEPGGRTAAQLQRHTGQQTRWHLCRRILAMHGGQLREEHESGARNFMVDLPCGAPFPADNPALDVEQAHRYARDLAALMAQTRRRGTLVPGLTTVNG